MAQHIGSMVGIRIAGIAGTAGIHPNASRTAGSSCVRIAGIHRNASSRIAGIALLLASLLSSLPAAHAQCYLLNANSNCSVCWKTVYGDLADKTGVTTSAECPDAIAVKWTEAPPKEMLALETYPLKYSLSVNPQKFEVVKQGANQVPHANIHSCIASKVLITKPLLQKTLRYYLHLSVTNYLLLQRVHARRLSPTAPASLRILRNLLASWTPTVLPYSSLKPL
jgi:hypothetical protein